VNARIPHHGSFLPFSDFLSPVATTTVDLDFLGEYSAPETSFPHNMTVPGQSLTDAGSREAVWID
jgi:hypothetical protein